MADKMIRVYFDGKCDLQFAGHMDVPAIMWGEEDPEEGWSENVERYIRDHLGMDHVTDVEFDYADIHDVMPLKEEESGD